MNRNSIKNYLAEILIYFKLKKRDILRIFKTYIRHLEFLKCFKIVKNKVFFCK